MIGSHRRAHPHRYARQYAQTVGIIGIIGRNHRPARRSQLLILTLVHRRSRVRRSCPLASNPVGDALTGGVTEHDPHVSNDLWSEAEGGEGA